MTIINLEAVNTVTGHKKALAYLQELFYALLLLHNCCRNLCCSSLFH
jgi:hypothetical protein